MTPRTFASFVALIFASLLATSCQSVITESDAAPVDPADYVAFDTFAWDDRPPAALTGRGIKDAAMSLETRQAVEAALGRLGIYPSERRDASLLLSEGLSTRIRQRSKDPFFTFYVAEKWEEGYLTLEFRDARGGDVIWRGLGRSELRVVARGNGVNRLRFTATDNERVWPVEEMIESILDQSGLRGAEAAREAGNVGPPPFLRRNAKRSLYRKIYETAPDDDSWIEEGMER